MEFTVRYRYLDPMSESVEADNAFGAASAFLLAHGGKKGNYGRCVLVSSPQLNSGEELMFALIYDTDRLHLLDKTGEPYLHKGVSLPA